jgi:uncharacterized protein (TIGR00725 family)
MQRSKLLISVIGAGQASAEELRLAEAVGVELAKKGAALICGGLGGVMEAACRGSSEHGGLTIGILPGDNPRHANPYVELPLATGLGYARNAIVAKSSHAVIAIGGSYGTLSEIAFARQSGLPVISLGSWRILRKNKEDSSIITAKDAVDAVNKALEFIKK